MMSGVRLEVCMVVVPVNNEAGEQLLELCAINNLTIMNT